VAGKWIERADAVEALADMLSEALAEHPKIEPFLIDFWRHCRRADQAGRDLDNLPIASKLFKRMVGGTSTPASSGSAYVAYKEWMASHEYDGEPILAVAQTVRPGRCRTYRINLPLCKPDPWRSVKVRLPSAEDSSVFTPTQIQSIRRRISEVAMYRHRFMSGPAAREASLVQTAQMAVYHALLTTRRAKPHIVARWPDEYGVDLAAWHRQRSDPHCVNVPKPYLLIHVGLADEALEPFDYAIKLAPHAERVLICVRKPTPKLASEARSRQVQIIRLNEPNQAGEV